MATTSDFKFERWVRTAKERIRSLPKRVSGAVEAEVNVTPPLDANEIKSLALVRVSSSAQVAGLPSNRPPPKLEPCEEIDIR